MLIKPCSYCGFSSPKIRKLNSFYQVICPTYEGGCGAASLLSSVEDEAIEAWNKRAKLKRWEVIAKTPDSLVDWRLKQLCDFCTSNVNGKCIEETKKGTEQINCRPGVMEYLNQEVD